MAPLPKRKVKVSTHLALNTQSGFTGVVADSDPSFNGCIKPVTKSTYYDCKSIGGSQDSRPKSSYFCINVFCRELVQIPFKSRGAAQCFTALQFVLSLKNSEITVTPLWFSFGSAVLLEILFKQHCHSFEQICEAHLGNSEIIHKLR